MVCEGTVSTIRYATIRLALDGIAALGLDRLSASRFRGRGVILTFHHVAPPGSFLLDENAGLSISPAFLETTILTLRELGYQIIPQGEIAACLADEDSAPFAVLTFDDGYRDNLTYALPILRRHEAPFTLFVCPGFAERTAALWWLDIEEAITKLHTLRLELPDGGLLERAETDAEKRHAARLLYWRLRDQPEAVLQAAVSALCRQAGVDQMARVARLCMDWEALETFAAEPLASLGAHTLSHPRLARLDDKLALAEMALSRKRIEERLEVSAGHFAYPVGDPGSAGPREYAFAEELGFLSAVTTVPGVLHRGARMAALPRISVNGLFQEARYLRALLSGLPFAFSRSSSAPSSG